MATAKKNKPKGTNRPKPLAHTPGLTKSRRRYEKGGKLKTSQNNNRNS